MKGVQFVKVNKFKDFIERVGWTAIQAAAAAGVTALTDPHITWGAALKIVGVAAGVAAMKVIGAQNVGDSGLGDALPGTSVVETTPTPPPPA